MSETIDLFEAMYTQRAIRYFKTDPVPEEVILKLVEAATKAPSGGNSQNWKFIVIRDPELRRRISEYYKTAWDAAYGGQPVETRVRISSSHLSKHMHEVPVLILACVQHDGSPGTMGRGSSIYPAVQNLLLAARGLGLGSVLTTLHKQSEKEIKQLLGIPDNVETAALLPIGYPTEGARYGPTSRRPVEEVLSWDGW